MLVSSLPLASLVLLAGLAVLVVASDQLVAGAARLSSRLGVAPIVVGVVIIGFGTSVPELLVSLLAAVEGVFDLGVGNIIGSNIANVLLVLGVAAIAAPVVVGRSVHAPRGTRVRSPVWSRSRSSSRVSSDGSRH
jgi:cation:H+ antiporter